MAKLSVVISAYNEEKNLEQCLNSVAGLSAEIIVIDNCSNDKTAEIAQKLGAKVYSQPNNLMLNTNKNYGFDRATGSWILNLDADERLTLQLLEEIKSKIRDHNSKIDGYWIPRKNILFGKWIKSEMWWPDYQLRLFKKDAGQFPGKHVHEHLEIKGQTEKLKQPIIHYNYSSIGQFLQKMDKIYTENEVNSFLQEGKKIKWGDAFSWPVDDFLKTFFRQKGYQDGLHGLVLSLLQAFYSFVLFAKIWEKEGFKGEAISLDSYAVQVKQNLSNVNYWLWESKIRESNNFLLKIIYKVKRKTNL